MLWVGIAVVIVIVLIVGAAWATGLIGKSNTTVTGCALLRLCGNQWCWVDTGLPVDVSSGRRPTRDSAVNYNGVGSTAGIQAITGQTVDYGASDAPLNPAQRAAAPGLLILPESAGAVVPVYNVPGLLQPIQFTGSILAQIFMGNITNWGDPALKAINPAITLPNATITPVHRADGSGTTFIFSSYLGLESPTFAKLYPHATAINWPSFELASKGNSGVASTVQTTTYAIGYVDINFAAANSISYGKVQNPSGAYILGNVTNAASALADSNVNFPAPSADWYNFSVLNAPGAGDYPITSFTYVMIYQDPGTAFKSLYTEQKAKNLVDFLWWAITVGQQYSKQLFYIPLPANAVTFDENELKSITYNGAALPLCTSTS